MLAPNNIPEDVDLENAFYRVTEYLHNGTLEEFINRIRDLDSVPNRVLWYIFQCREFFFFHSLTLRVSRFGWNRRVK